jgi:hypothetical protein
MQARAYSAYFLCTLASLNGLYMGSKFSAVCWTNLNNFANYKQKVESL